jgi:putative spermidine/putrescine transport system substrate-binding protein
MKKNINQEYSSSRRSFLKKSSIIATASALSVRSPYVFSKQKTTLRVMGTHVTLQEEIRQKAMADLGINIIFEPGGEAELIQKASTQPELFDVYEQWTDSIRQLWQAGAIQPIETKKITHWEEINAISKTGKIHPNAQIGLGDSPHKILNVQPDSSLGENFTGEISFLPYVHNVDSFGYNSNIVPRGIPYQTESWAWLLDDDWRGKVGIVNSPTIGIFDLALAVQSKGFMQFQDISNMSINEIDELFRILIQYKKQGHFAGLWNTVPQSVDFMTSGRVVIESMFSPAVASANGQGIPVVYAAPKEGYRAWHGVMCLSSQCEGQVKDAAYDYMNWWLEGWAGAYVAKQGYYISTPERSRPLMSENEWDYWYMGRPTPKALRGNDGKISVNAGDRRSGGSYHQRFSNIAVWNTVMPNYDYSLQKWYEFLLA